MAAARSTQLVFSVKRREAELVRPAKPTPREIKQLSEIDNQQSLRYLIPVIMFYWNGNTRSNEHLRTMEDPVKVLREAISKSLVFYYPLAGRLVEFEEPNNSNGNNKLAVDCTRSGSDQFGVLFVEADADVSLEELGDSIHPPCPYVKELLCDVPAGSGEITNCPLLLIQVTRLSCGGFVLGIRFNHAITDVVGLVQFLKATSDMARGLSTPSLLPVWQRHLLKSRSPPRITCVHHEYEVDSNSPSKEANTETVVHRSFFFGSKEMRAILKTLPPHLQSSSKWDVLVACLWRSRTIALQPDPSEIVRVAFTVSVRGKRPIRLPPGYYGNSFVCPGAISDAGKLCESPLAYALELVKKVRALVCEEYVRSVTDLMVIKGWPPFSTSWSYIVSDTRIVGEVDLGWGKPVSGGPVGAWTFNSICSTMRNGGEEGTVVTILLPLAAMERFKEEIGRMTGERDGPVEETPRVMKNPKINSML